MCSTKKEPTPEEMWDKATIANNFIFYKIMRHNRDVCKELLEILLEIEIDHIVIRNEETVEIDFGSKGIRMDVYAKNNKQAFNIEMQATDTKELPERSRYYQGCIDVDCLESGRKYMELKDSYVIFICIPDIFEKGLARYSFENLCLEDNSIHLKDRAYKYFFIASNCDKILNKKLKAFLGLVIGRKPSDEFSKRLAQLTEQAKKNTQWRKQYMEWERQMAYKFAEGAQKQAEETAIRMLMSKYDISEIVRISGLPQEQVLELQEKIAVKA